ncbi:MAG: TldD/PmbA family protein [Tannerella sp.]|jgi:predicted Zn-dependent protease|nr:TldD/PmbA family protein [Tannerella sp.]
MNKKLKLLMLFVCIAQMTFAQDKLTDILKGELNRNFTEFKSRPVPAYYMSYRVHDVQSHNIRTSFGNLVGSFPRHERIFNVDIHVGSYELDNTRELRGSNSGWVAPGANSIALDDNSISIRTDVWRVTDEVYKDAIKQFDNVKANVAVKVEAEDKSNDFSKEKAEKYFEPVKPLKDMKFDAAEWTKKLKKYSAVFNDNKDVLSGNAGISIELVRKYFVDTEGSEIVENAYAYRLMIDIQTVAEDGMSLPLYQSYYAKEIKDFPSDEQVIKDAGEMSAMLSKLRKASVVESYSGPALMTAEAAGVFFHEIFGHRVEGARLKKDSDAQTFKKKLGQSVLPKDISIFYDSQLKYYKGIPLNGYYVFDDEGVRGQRVDIVKDGVLNAFLTSRVPIEGFPNSNGHGRAVIQADNVTRQSNMIIVSSQPKSSKELRKLLTDQLKQEQKEYGYLFDKVSGGFTTTGRYMPNAFNVTPLIVYKIFADGRPDELVRGVDLVGTPLSIFSQVAACGDDHGAFNGYCGAESGSLPVSCVSPTLYIKMIETQKKSKSQTQPPILERP